jgi:hypothetical protein
MNPAIVHISSSVATLRFGCCAEGSVAVYTELAECVCPEPVEGVTLSLSKGTLVPAVYTQMCKVLIFKCHK